MVGGRAKVGDAIDLHGAHAPGVPSVALTNRRKSPFRRFDSFPCGKAAQQSLVPNRQHTRAGVPVGFRILREVMVRGIPGHGFPSGIAVIAPEGIR